MLVGLRRVAACLFVAAMGVFVVACGGGGGGSSTPPPTITVQPADVDVDDGVAVQFAVTATGEAPLSYQWRRNGAPIAGATSATYSIPSPPFADNGVGFSVTVANAGGSVTSRAALLTVRPVAPVLTVSPQSSTADDGSTATFSVAATGSAPLSYQWLRDGAAIVGATTPDYTTGALTLGDDGASYSVTVTNVAGTATSAGALLSVRPVAPSIVSAPAPVTVRDGAPVSLSVVAAGSAPLAYQWYDASGQIGGATQAEFTFNAAFANSGATYRVEISNAAGSVTSAAVAVTVDPNAPSIDVAPTGTSVAPGATASFSTSVSGTAPLTFQWERSDDGVLWQTIPGAVTPTLNLPNVTLALAGSRVRVVASNPAAVVSSAAVTLSVVPNVHIVAGAIGGAGFSDGVGDAVRLSSPAGAVADSAGNVYVAESGNRVIRRITPDGQTSVFAGQAGAGAVYIDGTGATARFIAPYALAIDAADNLYVGDFGSIRKITPGAMVSTLAGASGSALGSADGTGSAARFHTIVGIASDAAGNLTVADAGANQTIRRVSAAGEVTTLAGVAGQFGSVDGQGSAARFVYLRGITLDGLGNAFVGDEHTVRRITPAGDVTLYAGSPGQSGDVDGPRLSARFAGVAGLAFIGSDLYLGSGFAIRRIAADGSTTTLASTAQSPVALAVLPASQGLVFSEFGSATVRRVTTAGVVDTLAGVAAPTGPMDGVGPAARFHGISKLASDDAGTLFVADWSAVRRIASDGSVTTLTSSPALSDFAAYDVARMPSGGFVVADALSHVIRRVSASGVISTFAGVEDVSGSSDGPVGSATFNAPQGIAVDANGVVYVADSGNHTIRRIDPGGTVTTLAGAAGVCGGVDGTGSSARFCGPLGITTDVAGNVFVADTSTHTIRRVTPAGVVTTYAGVLNSPGRSEGTLARFLHPKGLAFDASGNLFVADSGNSLVRRITPARVTSTVMGQYGTSALLPGPGGAINAPSGIAVLPGGRIVVVTEQAVVGD